MDIARIAQVKNKNPAAIQITAEQLLREASERQTKPLPKPQQKIQDKEELLEYQLLKRKECEDAVRRNRTAIGAWLRYADLEEKWNELDRCRSVYERALEHQQNQTLWLKYVEMEMRQKNVNRARNLLDRVVAILPRVDVFWLKYTMMEEVLGNVQGARLVFERWMKWEPSEEAWMSYVQFETRYKEFDRARAVFRRFVTCRPHPKNWIRYAKFEEERGDVAMARRVYENCVEEIPDFVDQNFYISFASFETRCKEYERARLIYQYALDSLQEKENLYNAYTRFEKQFGDKDQVEEVMLSKKRLDYEAALLEQPWVYDTWFDYLRLEESLGQIEKIRHVYERAIAQVPPVKEKRYWRRYVYLWIYYAVWEELETGDKTRCETIYTSLLELIPHSVFTFAKCWTLYARFLIRQHRVDQARKCMGRAIGSCPKPKLYQDYIQLELGLREFDRVRVLYTKFLEWDPTRCMTWIQYCELESMLGEDERCRALYELGISREELDTPELLWKSYLDFEMDRSEWVRCRDLYKRLLQRTDHVKVYISWANFERVAGDGGVERARKVFEETMEQYRKQGNNASRVTLLEAWMDFETEHGTPDSLERVRKQVPKAVKRRRRVEQGWEEYFDYVFPEEEDGSHVRLLALAHQWKMGAGEDSEEDE
jgi:crooked neck